MLVVYHVITIFLAIATAVLTFFSLATPAWTTQSYDDVGGTASQGFGLFQFHSTLPVSGLQWKIPVNGTITNSNLCALPDITSDVSNALCGTWIKVSVAFYIIAALIASVVLVASVVSACRPMPGWPERIVNWGTFAGGLFIVGVLMIWALSIQDQLLNSDLLNPEYSVCKQGVLPKWTCWFYGYCYWIGLAATVSFALTGSFSSCAVSHKYKKASRAEEEAIAAAVMASTMHEGQTNYHRASTQGGQNPTPAPFQAGSNQV